ncbi:MAG: LacI family DNA-binding transcriptional regulator [Anaerolineaceae bacterium]|nr:LacI family DNA-binding transcriptional regulator [Anaerolineaceae bacterium]
MKRATIEDVAALAGVSRQTVSRAINDKGEISPATKEKVMAAVQQLGYQPNRQAQSMVTQRTQTVGLVIPDISNLFFPEVARGVQDTARKHNYNVLLCNTDDDPDEEIRMLHSLAAQGVDGIIIIGNAADQVTTQTFADSYGPIVMVNRFFDHPNVNIIIVDNEQGAFLAVEHLIQQGHVKIGMLANKNFSRSQVRRVRGYEKALTENGIPYDEALIVGASPTLEGGYNALNQLLGEHPEITAVFTYNDLMGIGAIRAAHDLNKRVPQDLAVVGFDNIGLSSIFIPSLSSIHVDKYEIGQRAMNRILNMLDTPNKSFAPIELPVTLIPRESST